MGRASCPAVTPVAYAEVEDVPTGIAAQVDGYRRERDPANLIQGLRDYFGAHTYRRVDAKGSFHTRWSQDGTEVRTGA